MLPNWLITLAALAYLGGLFAIAFWGDQRADARRSLIANPYVYALSWAVYCTSWTYYGSVGRAANAGLGFLPIYLGPTLVAGLAGVVLRKMVRISKRYRITSIADLIASRYGKSTLLGGLVTLIAIIGTMPYIALQLKAISTSFSIMLSAENTPQRDVVLFTGDIALYIALFLAAFTVLFGTRSLDATERHEGMVLAIAFESIVKLVAFLAVGLFVTYGLFGGLGALFTAAAASPRTAPLLSLGAGGLGAGDWGWLMLLSMLAVLLLPRQFQVAVVENVSEQSLAKAAWLFPLYMLLINIFVLPIALAGLLRFAPGSVNPDTFVLSLPLDARQPWLALLAFIGGLSAATGMIIVETIALSTMVCNDLVMPALLRIRRLRLNQRRDLSQLLLTIRRAAIVLLLLLGYVYFRVASAAPLVSLGLVSFAAVAQFAPAMIGGLFWKGGTRAGALSGLLAGFAVWSLTLLLPGLLPAGHPLVQLIARGADPRVAQALGWHDPLSYAAFWSLLLNTGLYVAVSLFTRQTALEQRQALLFVDVFRRTDEAGTRQWSGPVAMADLRPAADALPRADAGRRDVGGLQRAPGPRPRAADGRGRRAAELRREPAGRRDRRGLGAGRDRLDRHRERARV